MGLVLRSTDIPNTGVTQVKNAALTYAEGDGNFAWLATNLSGSSISITGSTAVTGSLTVTSKLGVNVASPTYNVDISGSFRSYGGVAVFDTYTTVREALNLEAQHPLPAGTLGDLATSGSALWFYDGGSWREVSLL